MIDSRWSLRLALSTLMFAAAMPAAQACTGSANDPVHCINNNQAINGFGQFFSENLQPLPTQNLDDASGVAQSTYDWLAPRVGALPGGVLRSNFALYSDLDGGAAEVEHPEAPAVWEAHGWWLGPETTGEAPESGSRYPVGWTYFPNQSADGDPPESETRNLTRLPPSEFVATLSDLPEAETRDLTRLPPSEFVATLTDLPESETHVPGKRVGGMTWLNQGQTIELVVVEQADGKHVAVGPDGHVYGGLRQSRSGFGWRFDGPVTPPPGTTGGRVLDGR